VADVGCGLPRIERAVREILPAVGEGVYHDGLRFGRALDYMKTRLGSLAIFPGLQRHGLFCTG